MEVIISGEEKKSELDTKNMNSSIRVGSMGWSLVHLGSCLDTFKYNFILYNILEWIWFNL